MGMYRFSIYWDLQIGLLLKFSKQFVQIRLPFISFYVGLDERAEGINLFNIGLGKGTYSYWLKEKKFKYIWISWGRDTDVPWHFSLRKGVLEITLYSFRFILEW